MGIFGNLGKEGLEEQQDRLGGFAPLETDIYLAKIKVAYALKSSGGAQGVSIVADIDGREYRETLWVSNKKGENFWMNDDKKVALPGFTVMDDMCLVTCDMPLKDMEAEEKMINIWSYEEKKEVPTAVPVLTEMLGKEVYLGIWNNLENKSEKGDDGNYHDIADTRVTNTIDKVFHHPSKMTVVEATNGKDPEFFDKWQERNKGQQRDKRSIKDGEGGTSGRPAGEAPKSGDKAPKKSLFG